MPQLERGLEPGPVNSHAPGSLARRPRARARLLVLPLATAVIAGGGSGALVARLVDRTTVRPAPAAGVQSPPVTSADVPAIVSAMRPSVVSIESTATGTDVFGQPVTRHGSGTGFVLTANGLIATNAHVIAGAQQISVTLADGSTARARVVGEEPRRDLAVLRIGRTGLTPARLGSSGHLRVGVMVVAIGNALALGASPTASLGIVSALDRSVTTANGTTYTGLIQTDAAINPGDSGGPLVNAAGQIVGINTAGVTSAENIGFAISIDVAKPVLTQLAHG